MECKFISGQEVICINDDPFYPPNNMGGPGDLDGLKAGNKYTVKNVFVEPQYGLPCITIFEIFRGTYSISARGCDGEGEHGFYAYRFRPIETAKTDISVLEKLLQPKERVLEDV